MNRLIQVVITTILISLSLNIFAEVRKSYYESGVLQSETNYKNDKKEGLTKRYHESGALKTEGSYKNGEYDGLYKVYSESGLLMHRSNFKNGKLLGKWTRK